MKDTCWKPDPYVQDLMKQKGFTTTEEVFTYFLNTIGDTVKKETGKKLIFWAETGAFVERDESHILQYWTEVEEFATFYNKYPKHKKIISVVDKYYFDLGFVGRYGNAY